MNILALETSCDETAASVVRDGRTVLSSVVSSQIALHAVHGGVVPELAARAHLEAIGTVVEGALEPVSGWDAIDAIAVTRGPGLAGCLVIGSAFAQSAAAARSLPITGVSHLAGHVYSAWLSDAELEPPFLALVVSGGHTDCVELREHGRAESIATTRDDAVGEAFDKVARLLGLGYPGGPAIQKAAEAGDASRFPLPRTHLDGAFSFSGLKTAVRYGIEAAGAAASTPEFVADVAAAFQEAAVDQLVYQLDVAAVRGGAEQIAVVGGVAANRALREAVQSHFQGLRVSIPPMSLCTDNAAMIGAAGWHRLRTVGPDEAGFDIDPALDEFA